MNRFLVLFLFIFFGEAVSGFAKHRSALEWEATKWVWNGAIMGLCDRGVDRDPVAFYKREDAATFDPAYYSNIRKGDIVWLQCRFVKDFVQQILPYTDHPFVLVISGSDDSFPSCCGLSEDQWHIFFNHEHIIHIFAQNCDLACPHPKVSLIPIGLDFHTIGYKNPEGGWGERGSPLQQENFLNALIQTLPPIWQRKSKAFVDFHHCGSMFRTQLFQQLEPSGCFDHMHWVRRSELWRTKGQYAFSISPHGNGLDCHRTWEDLVLGCIVIVKTSTLDPLYEGLPVIIIHDWTEITLENMERWKKQYQDILVNSSYREKLTHQYWMNKILTAAAPYRSIE